MVMPPNAFAQRFLKWHMKACDRDYAQFLRDAEFIDQDSYKTLLEVAALYERKNIRLLGRGFGWSEIGTIYEALIWTYYLSAKYELASAKVIYRGQRDFTWSIVSSKSRSTTGQASVFMEELTTRIHTRHTWHFPDQLAAAARHYGFPTDMIDFTQDYRFGHPGTDSIGEPRLRCNVFALLSRSILLSSPVRLQIGSGQGVPATPAATLPTPLRPCLSATPRSGCPALAALPSGHRQRPDPAQHVTEQPPVQMSLGQQQPVVAGMFDQTAAGLH